MVATISFNPVLTSNAAGSFNIQSDGYIQGQAMDSPNTRNDLAGGVLASTETKPMWGGVAISENIPSSTINATNTLVPLGGQIIRATTQSLNTAGQITGFSVFDQAHGMINSPQSPVPQSGTGMLVHFYRMKSFARIAVACDPSLVSLQTGVITQQVSWDFTNQILQPYDASTATQSVTSMTWSSTNGGQVAVVVAAASLVGAVGDTFTISGATNSGTAGNSVVNGSFVANTWTDNQHFTFLLPGTSTTIGTIAGTILLNMGIGALPVNVLDVQVGNCMTVNYNAGTGFLTWNRNGSCALIQI
jgi:hypothetical protein